MRWGHLLCLTLVWTIQSHGEESDAVQEKPGFLIEKDVPIEMLFGNYHMIVDLGALPVGVTGIAKLNLINKHQVTFPVDDLELGCSCTRAQIAVPEIEPFSSAILEVTLSTRSGSKHRTITNSLTLLSKSDKSKNIQIALRYSLSGLMCFTGNAYVQEVVPSLDRQTVMVPFLLTDPVVASDVSFEVIPETHGVVASLVQEDGKRFAKIVFDPAFVSDDSLPLSVIARDESRGLTDTHPLLLCKRKYMEITPRTLRFRSEDDQLVAACLLRYRPPLADSTEVVDRKEGAINVEASLGGVKLSVRTKKLGRGIYRVFLKGPKSELQERMERQKAAKVRWHVVTADKVYSVESLLSVDSFVSVSPSEESEESEEKVKP